MPGEGEGGTEMPGGGLVKCQGEGGLVKCQGVVKSRGEGVSEMLGGGGGR